MILQVAVDQMTMVQDGLEAAYGPLVHWRAPDELYVSDQTSKSVFRPTQYSGMLQLTPEQMALLEEEARRQEAQAIAQAILDNTEPAERTLRLDLIQSAAQEAVELAGRLALTGSGSAAVATYIAAITEKESFDSLFAHLFAVPTFDKVENNFRKILEGLGGLDFDSPEDLLDFASSPHKHPILGLALDYFFAKLGMGPEFRRIKTILESVRTVLVAIRILRQLELKLKLIELGCIGGAPIGLSEVLSHIPKDKENNESSRRIPDLEIAERLSPEENPDDEKIKADDKGEYSDKETSENDNSIHEGKLQQKELDDIVSYILNLGGGAVNRHSNYEFDVSDEAAIDLANRFQRSDWEIFLDFVESSIRDSLVDEVFSHFTNYNLVGTAFGGAEAIYQGFAAEQVYSELQPKIKRSIEQNGLRHPNTINLLGILLDSMPYSNRRRNFINGVIRRNRFDLMDEDPDVMQSRKYL